MENSDKTCPICRFEASVDRSDINTRWNCQNCGEFLFDRILSAMPNVINEYDDYQCAIISHHIHKRRREGPLTLTQEDLNRIIESETLPEIDRQLDEVLLWLGDRQRAPGRGEAITMRDHTAKFGAVNEPGLQLIFDHLISEDLLTVSDRHKPPAAYYNCQLTVAGWRKIQELKRGQSRSMTGFMAMDFNDPDIDNAFSQCFKPACKEAGFDLQKLDENPERGLLDEQMRVRILTSRFAVVDLTGNNSGAYWEAGYAEGLQKPVFYTCQKESFSSTHFDTNHHNTVLWENDNWSDPCKKLKAMIRAEFPDVAKLED